MTKDLHFSGGKPANAETAKAVTEKTLIGTIDLTPTWEQQVRTCLTILQDSKNSEAIAIATNELIRMGTLLDTCQGTIVVRDLVSLERIPHTGYFKDDVERWFDVTVIGSKYEQQTSTKGNWRHRYMPNHSVRGDWMPGRAPDIK